MQPNNRIVNNRPGVIVVWALLSIMIQTLAFADTEHYANILVGDRAAGLAGAYTAVSDDPSGLYYNPAGIVHSIDNIISGSMNAIKLSTKTYKNALGPNTNWVRESNELLPNFFGVLQDFKGDKMGFSYAVVDALLENQDQVFTNIPGIDTLVINFNNLDKTVYVGPSYALNYSDKLSFGITLYGHFRQQERILHEYNNISGDPANGGSYQEVTSYLATDEIGLRPILGIMYAPRPKISLGLTLSRTFLLNADTTFQQTVSSNNATLNSRLHLNSDSRRRLPWSLAAGIAYFSNKSTLITADLSIHESHKTTPHELEGPRQQVVNFSTGVEYYISPKWAVRTGLYTNYANTANLTKQNIPVGNVQPEKLDFYGLSFSATHFTRSTALSGGLNMSFGRGEAQLFGADNNGDARLQTIEATEYTFFLSATYSY